MSVRVEHGDCREVIKSLANCSVDSCVTDPPYHLTSIIKRFGNGQAPAQFGKDGRYARLSGGFMNQKWDAPDAAPVDPSFAHWFAGFTDGEGCFHVHKKTVNGCETYDCQFSINLRADDKQIIREIQRQLGGIGTIADRPGRDGGNAQVRYCVSSQRDCWRLREILSAFSLRAKKARDFEIWSAALDEWIAHEPGESWEDVAYFREALMAVRQYGAQYHPSQLFHYQWARSVYRVLKPGGHLVAFCGTRTYHRMAAAIEDAGFEVRDCISWLFGSGFPKSHNLDGDNAGWGTALKPACELIILARRPLIGTVAANVLQHGTGALNIDGCRIETRGEVIEPVHAGRKGPKHGGKYGNSDDYTSNVSPLGRWPANLVHDGSEEVVAAFPDAGGGFGVRGESPNWGPASSGGGTMEVVGFGDSGNAARFFYAAKADADDRCDSKHPTVKPVSLMRWLARLVTPPRGLVLDPFAGSGTTGVACIRESFDAILIERETEYVADMRRRLARLGGADTPLFGAEAAHG